MPITRRPSIADLSPEEIHAALNGPRLSDEERERRNPQLEHMRCKAKAALHDLQEKGILDQDGRLIPLKELPADCQPESDTEC